MYLFFCWSFFAAHFYSPIILEKPIPKSNVQGNNIDPNPLEKTKAGAIRKNN
jgi:hypothetical protein